MRICVFGAGAVGGHIAARLARAGVDVAVVARGAHLEAMRANGLRVEAKDGTFTAAVRAEADPDALGVQDLVLVTAKAPALPAIGDRLAPLLGPTTPVAFVTNGLPWWYFSDVGGSPADLRLNATEPGESNWRLLKEGRVVGGVVYSACTVVRPGVVRVAHDRNRLVLGTVDGLASPAADACAKLLSLAGFPAETTDRIRDHIWEKIASHLAISPMSLLAEATIRDTFQSASCRATAVAVWSEIAGLAAALGCEIGPGESVLGRLSDDHKPSILQDYEMGRPLEIDAIYNAPLEAAQRMGIEIPLAALLIELANLKVRTKAAG